MSLPMMRSRGDCFVAAAWCLIILAGTCRADDAAAVAGTAETERAPTELSVAPLEFPSYPADRPDWIDQAPQLDGAVHQWPIVSVPSLDRERCRESLREQANIAISVYASHLFEQDHDGHMHAPLDIKESWIEASLGDAERIYSGTVETSDGEMLEEAALLRFDDAFRDALRKEWRNQQVGRRLTGLGLFSGGSMALLIALSSVLRRAGLRNR